MSRKIPFDAIPDSVLIDDGAMCEFEIEALEETHSKSGKLMYKASYRVLQPAQFIGLMLFDNFVIGNDDDPEADDPNTWKRTGVRFKQLFKKANVPTTGDVERDLIAAKGCRFMASVVQKEDAEGEYKGRVRNNLGRMYAIGEREPAGATASNGASAPRPAGAHVAGGREPWRPGQPAR